MMNKKFKKLALSVATLFTTLSFYSSTAHAEVGHYYANPHPYLIDQWEYGVTNQNLAFSYYFMKSDGYGSKSSVGDSWGRTHSSAVRDIGWANSAATKSIWWGVAHSYWDTYPF